MATVSTSTTPPSITPGTGGLLASTEGTAPSVGFPATTVDGCYADSTAHGLKCSFNNDTSILMARNVAAGTLALLTGAITSGACTAAQTATATGAATSDIAKYSFSGDPTGVTGYTSTGDLRIYPYVTADTFNVKVCNKSGGSITPGALTLNWAVEREPGGGGGGGSIALVAHTAAQYTGSDPFTSSSINTTTANFIAIVIADYGQIPAETVSDSKGNTYTALTGKTTGAGGAGARIYYKANPTVGTGHTFTIASTSFSSFCVAAFSNVKTTSPFDVENGNTATGGPTTITTGSITPGATNELLFSGLAIQTGTSEGTTSINNSFTITDQILFGASPGNMGVTCSYLVDSASSAINPAWTMNAGTGAQAAVIAAFQHP